MDTTSLKLLNKYRRNDIYLYSIINVSWTHYYKSSSLSIDYYEKQSKAVFLKGKILGNSYQLPHPMF